MCVIPHCTLASVCVQCKRRFEIIIQCFSRSYLDTVECHNGFSSSIMRIFANTFLNNTVVCLCVCVCFAPHSYTYLFTHLFYFFPLKLFCYYCLVCFFHLRQRQCERERQRYSIKQMSGHSGRDLSLKRNKNRQETLLLPVSTNQAICLSSSELLH